MQTIYFHNPSELDIRGAYIAGLSAKSQDQAIGKFGTGLKYAIASILRWGGAISIKTGGEEFTFVTRQIDFRGKAHDQIVMINQQTSAMTELGFTTHYGEHWADWQVFRELYSNALDEGGGVSLNMGRPSASGTVITVHCSKVADCYTERDTIILPQKGKDVDAASGYDVHLLECPSNFLYYRGVRVRKAKCLFTWNLLDGVTLTEDRSVEDTWAFECGIAMALQNSTDRNLIAKALRAGEGRFEGGVNYSAYYQTSPEFVAEAMTLYKQEGRKQLPNGVWSILCKHAPEVDEPEPHVMSPLQQKMLNRAIELVERMGCKPRDVRINVVKLQKNTLGQAKNGQVYLSPAVFDQGTKQVVSTLLEECVHLETGLKDCNYEMQTYLFNRIVSLYEEHVFEEAC